MPAAAGVGAGMCIAVKLEGAYCTLTGPMRAMRFRGKFVSWRLMASSHGVSRGEGEAGRGALGRGAEPRAKAKGKLMPRETRGTHRSEPSRAAAPSPTRPQCIARRPRARGGPVAPRDLAERARVGGGEAHAPPSGRPCKSFWQNEKTFCPPPENDLGPKSFWKRAQNVLQNVLAIARF